MAPLWRTILQILATVPYGVCVYCTAAALDETNDRVDISKIGDRSFIRSDPNLIGVDRDRFRVSTKIGAFFNAVIL